MNIIIFNLLQSAIKFSIYFKWVLCAPPPTPLPSATACFVIIRRNTFLPKLRQHGATEFLILLLQHDSATITSNETQGDFLEKRFI